VLAIYTVFTTTIIDVSPYEWGLVSKLPPPYWTGLSGVGALVLIGRKSKKWLAIALFLTVLYLYGIPAFITVNPRVMMTSYPAAEGKLIADGGRFIPDKEDLYRYHNTPGFLFFVAVLELVTKIPLEALCKYFPLLTISLYGLLVYSALRLKFEVSRSLMGTLWFICSWFVWQDYFSPQSIGFSFFLLIFVFVARNSLGEKNQAAPLRDSLVLLLLFFAAVMTHLLTALMILVLFLVLFAFYKDSRRLLSGYVIVAVLVIASCYVVFEATPLFNQIVSEILSSFPGLLSLQFARGQVAGSFVEGLNNLTRYVIIAVGLIAVLLFLSMRKEGNYRKFLLLSLFALILPMFISPYGLSEMMQRVYMFSLVLLAFMVVRSFASRKTLILCAIIFLLLCLHIPAYFGGSSFEIVTNSEVAGAKFYLNTVNMNSSIFSLTLKLVNLMRFEKPASIKGPLYLQYLQPINYTLIETFLEKAQFVAYSKSDCNQFLYYQGRIPVSENNIEPHFNRVYDNPYVQIFSSHG
jgi:hypothetical protein